MIISIFASIGSHNLWDELILKNEIKFFREKYKSKNPTFIVFSYDLEDIFYEAEDIEYKQYFPLWFKNPKNIYKNIFNFFVFLKYTILSDLIVIWWWGLFFDNEEGSKKNPLDLWIFRIHFFKFFLKKIYFFRIWLSIKKQESFLKIKKIFSGKRNIIEVRDNYSKKVLEDLGIKNILKKYDPVFLDNWEKIEEILNKKVSIKKILKKFTKNDLEDIVFEGKKVWIAFRSWYLTKNLNPEMEILLMKEIIEIIQKKWAKVILLPHSFHKTDILSNDFAWMKHIQSKTVNVEITKNMLNTYNMYWEKKVDIIFAQRLHSIILSQVYEIPFVWISYSKKTSEILSELK